MQDYYLESKGIAYRTNELRADRETLVFIHGLSGSCSAWKPFEEHFENKYNVVTYDLRGHGLSKRYKKLEDYAIENFAADLTALLTHLRIEISILIAHSFGALVALELNASTPSMVKKNIFLCPSYHIGSYTSSRLSNPFVSIATALYSFLPMRIVNGKRINYDGLPRPSADISLRRIAPEIHAMTVRTYLYCLQHMYEYVQDGKWQTLAAPTRILHGTKDSFVPIRYGRKAAEASHATFVELTDANHMLVLNNAGEIMKEIDIFIS